MQLRSSSAGSPVTWLTTCICGLLGANISTFTLCFLSCMHETSQALLHSHYLSRQPARSYERWTTAATASVISDPSYTDPTTGNHPERYYAVAIQTTHDCCWS